MALLGVEEAIKTSVCVGCGLDVDEFGILEVKLRPGGGIACDNSGDADDGLYLSGAGSIGIVVDDSATIDFSGDGSSGSHLTGSVKLSGDSCNGLKAGSDGKLYALCPKGNAGSSAIQTSPQGSGLPQAVVNGGNYTYLNDNSASSIHICNNSCNLLEGVVTVNVGDCYFVGHPGFIGSAHLEVNINSGGFNAIEPSTRQTFSVDSADAQNHYLDINQHADLFLSLASGDCVDYQFALVFNINTASGSTINTDSTGPKFVTRWVLIQDGGC